ANLFDELTTQGPRSQALDDGEAAEQLLAEVSAGRLPREAVRGVLDGVGQARAVAQTYPDGMTRREAEVLRELARGKTNKEIARALEVAPKTVDNHLQNLYRKIGAQSRAAAAMYAFEQGIFSA
ncbi:MAG: response regulator transcription factor, partial [Hyphomicrobiales bacterium]|nr:response regulator transcription factor [Hyphomicrobiales bacterium]